MISFQLVKKVFKFKGDVRLTQAENSSLNMYKIMCPPNKG